MQTDSSQDTPYPSETAKRETLDRELRDAGVPETEIATKAAELLPYVGWTIPDPDGNRKLLARPPGVTRYGSIADAVKPEPAPPAPLATPKTTAEHVEERRAARRAGREPLIDPAPGTPDLELSAEQYVQRQRYLRSTGQRKRL